MIFMRRASVRRVKANLNAPRNRPNMLGQKYRDENQRWRCALVSVRQVGPIWRNFLQLQALIFQRRTS